MRKIVCKALRKSANALANHPDINNDEENDTRSDANKLYKEFKKQWKKIPRNKRKVEQIEM